MTIEVELGRIATALEKIASGQGNLPLATPAAPAKRGPGRPPKAEAKPEPEPVAEPESADSDDDNFLGDDDDDGAAQPTIEDVRTAIIAYQKRVGSQEKARKLLKDVGGADTLKSLDESKYAAVIEATKK